MAMRDPNELSLADLYAELSRTGLVRRLLELARDEDLGAGSYAIDVTSAAMPDPRRVTTARLNARQACTVSGLAAVPEVLRVFDAAGSVRFTSRATDGDRVAKGACLGELTGPVAAVLAIERTLLNLVSRLSGVATLTRTYVDRIAAEAPGSRAGLYDTRKTTPGLRVLEKYSVRCGGGRSHRLGLHDAVLIKDNHIAGVSDSELAAVVAKMAAAARGGAGSGPARELLFVEVEVDTLEQLSRLLTLPAGTIDIVLLDNMPAGMLRDAVAMRDRAGAARLELEASGGVSLETVGAIAATGVDRISCGALTHQAVSVDLGLDIG